MMQKIFNNVNADLEDNGGARGAGLPTSWPCRELAVATAGLRNLAAVVAGLRDLQL